MPPCDADPASRAGADAPWSGRRAPSLAFVLPAEPATSWLVRTRVRTWLEQLAWPAALVDDIEYAVSEAVSNVAEHAYGTGGGTVELQATAEDAAGGARRIRVRIDDTGCWRPAEPDPGLRGRGLFMMDALMDEVVIRRGEAGAGGTEVVLVSPPAPPTPTGQAGG